MSNIESVTSFYNAFQAKDAKTMLSCYDSNTTFSDPVFPSLKGREAQAMWQMLCRNGKDLEVNFKILDENGHQVRVFWDAYYTFSATGKKVHNKITSTLTFKDGKVITHDDNFDFYAWARQAFGLVGLIVGWTPFFQAKVRQNAAASLKAFIDKN